MDLFENVPKLGDDQEDGEFVFMPDMDEGGLIDADQFGSDDEEFMSMVEFAIPGTSKNVAPKVTEPPALPEPLPVESGLDEPPKDPTDDRLVKEELIINDDMSAYIQETAEAIIPTNAVAQVTTFDDDYDCFDMNFSDVTQDFPTVEEILHDDSDIGNTAECPFDPAVSPNYISMPSPPALKCEGIDIVNELFVSEEQPSTSGETSVVKPKHKDEYEVLLESSTMANAPVTTYVDLDDDVHSVGSSETIIYDHDYFDTPLALSQSLCRNETPEPQPSTSKTPEKVATPEKDEGENEIFSNIVKMLEKTSNHDIFTKIQDHINGLKNIAATSLPVADINADAEMQPDATEPAVAVETDKSEENFIDTNNVVSVLGNSLEVEFETNPEKLVEEGPNNLTPQMDQEETEKIDMSLLFSENHSEPGEFPGLSGCSTPDEDKSQPFGQPDVDGPEKMEEQVAEPETPLTPAEGTGKTDAKRKEQLELIRLFSEQTLQMVTAFEKLSASDPTAEANVAELIQTIQGQYKTLLGITAGGEVADRPTSPPPKAEMVEMGIQVGKTRKERIDRQQNDKLKQRFLASSDSSSSDSDVSSSSEEDNFEVAQNKTKCDDDSKIPSPSPPPFSPAAIGPENSQDMDELVKDIMAASPKPTDSIDYDAAALEPSNSQASTVPESSQDISVLVKDILESSPRPTDSIDYDQDFHDITIPEVVMGADDDTDETAMAEEVEVETDAIDHSAVQNGVNGHSPLASDGRSKSPESDMLSDTDNEVVEDDDDDKEIERLLDFRALENQRTGEYERTQSKGKSIKKKKIERVAIPNGTEDAKVESESESDSENENEEAYLQKANFNLKEKLLAFTSESEEDSEFNDKNDDSDESDNSVLDQFLSGLPMANGDAEHKENGVDDDAEKVATDEKKEEEEEEGELPKKTAAAEAGKSSSSNGAAAKPGGSSKSKSKLDKDLFNDKFLDDSSDEEEASTAQGAPKKTKKRKHSLSGSSSSGTEVEEVTTKKSGADSDVEEVLDVSMFAKSKEQQKKMESVDFASASKPSTSKSTESKNTKPLDDCISLSSDSDIEYEKEDPNKRKRTFRGLLSHDQLADETKRAQKEEADRIKRLEKKNSMLTQHLSQSLTQQSQGGLTQLIEESDVVLDFDKKKNENITVHPHLVKLLKEHQVEGVKFMYDCCYGSVNDIKNHPGAGCILAHCMGLGKTLQLITLLNTVIRYPQLQTKRVLVICPKSTIENWADEITNWLTPIKSGPKLKVFKFLDNSDINQKIEVLKEWFQSTHSRAGCMLIGYEAFRTLVFYDKQKRQRQMLSLDRIQRNQSLLDQYLLNPGPDLIVCDEGHMIKNKKSTTNKAVTQVKTRRRIILTGTPIQNNLKEYYCMVNFIKPSFLGTDKEFNNLYAQPIKNGQHKDSSQKDIKFMKQRSYVLHKKLSKFVQRKEASVLKQFLPEKFEYVLFVPMTQIQEKLYKVYLDKNPLREESGGRNLLPDYTFLRKIWTHPKVLENAWQNAKEMKAKKDKKEARLQRTTTPDSEEDVPDDLLDTGRDEPGSTMLVTSDWWREYVEFDDLNSMRPSYKLRVMFEILKYANSRNEKVLIFSAFVAVLNIVEHFMKEIHKNDDGSAIRLSQQSQQLSQGSDPMGVANFRGPWEAGRNYYRLDGKTPKNIRHAMITRFNNPNNTECKCFLISSKAGGLGINLKEASRCILLDTSWNPANDQQNIFRIYRLGQKRKCYVYRLLAMGTMEEKVYSRSVTKQALSFRVVDEQQVDRHYNMAELAELYTLVPTDYSKRETPYIPKDELLAHLLSRMPEQVYKYHEHDSLLENKPEQDLSEEEKKEAWTIYETEISTKAQPFTSAFGGFPHMGDLEGYFGNLNYPAGAFGDYGAYGYGALNQQMRGNNINPYAGYGLPQDIFNSVNQQHPAAGPTGHSAEWLNYCQQTYNNLMQANYSPTRGANFTGGGLSSLLSKNYMQAGGMNMQSPGGTATGYPYAQMSNAAMETIRSLEKLTSPSFGGLGGPSSSTSSPNAYDRSNSNLTKGFYQYFNESTTNQPIATNYMSGGTMNLNNDVASRPLTIPPPMSSRPKSSGSMHSSMPSPKQQQAQQNRNNSPLNLQTNSSSSSSSGQKIKIHSIGGDQNSANNKEIRVQTVTSALSSRDSPPPSIIVRNTNMPDIPMSERQKKLEPQTKTNNIGIHYPAQKKPAMETLPSDIDMNAILKSTFNTTSTAPTSTATRPPNSAVGTIKLIPQNRLTANPTPTSSPIGNPMSTSVIKNNIRAPHQQYQPQKSNLQNKPQHVARVAEMQRQKLPTGTTMTPTSSNSPGNVLKNVQKVFPNQPANLTITKRPPNNSNPVPVKLMAQPQAQAKASSLSPMQQKQLQDLQRINEKQRQLQLQRDNQKNNTPQSLLKIQAQKRQLQQLALQAKAGVAKTLGAKPNPQVAQHKLVMNKAPMKHSAQQNPAMPPLATITRSPVQANVPRVLPTSSSNLSSSLPSTSGSGSVLLNRKRKIDMVEKLSANPAITVNQISSNSQPSAPKVVKLNQGSVRMTPQKKSQFGGISVTPVKSAHATNQSPVQSTPIRVAVNPSIVPNKPKPMPAAANKSATSQAAVSQAHTQNMASTESSQMFSDIVELD